MRNFKLSKKVIWLISLFIILVIGAYLLLNILPKIADISLKIQIAANIFIIISALFVGMQLLFYTLEFNDNNKKQKIEKAIEMAELYAKNIITNISYLYSVYKSIGISTIMSNIPDSSIIQFDMAEMNKIIPPTTQKEIEKKLSSIDYKILLSSKRVFIRGDNFTYNDYVNCYRLPKFTEDKETNEKLLSDMLNNELRNIRTDTLNQLEYICMYFNTGVADDRVIYQSLHQSFLLNTKILYFDVCKQNEDGGKNKFYTNIVTLYNKWNIQNQKAIEKEEKIIRKQAQKSISM